MVLTCNNSHYSIFFQELIFLFCFVFASSHLKVESSGFSHQEKSFSFAHYIADVLPDDTSEKLFENWKTITSIPTDSERSESRRQPLLAVIFFYSQHILLFQFFVFMPTNYHTLFLKIAFKYDEKVVVFQVVELGTAIFVIFKSNYFS